MSQRLSYNIQMYYLEITKDVFGGAFNKHLSVNMEWNVRCVAKERCECRQRVLELLKLSRMQRNKKDEVIVNLKRRYRRKKSYFSEKKLQKTLDSSLGA